MKTHLLLTSAICAILATPWTLRAERASSDKAVFDDANVLSAQEKETIEDVFSNLGTETKLRFFAITTESTNGMEMLKFSLKYLNDAGVSNIKKEDKKICALVVATKDRGAMIVLDPRIKSSSLRRDLERITEDVFASTLKGKKYSVAILNSAISVALRSRGVK